MSINREDSLVDYARKEIQSKIERGVYLPGSRLSASEISTSLGISRTPVILAINQLVSEGFAEKLSARNTVVTQLRLPQIREILQVREMIELYAVDLIIKNIPFLPEAVQKLENTSQAMLDICENDYRRFTELETQFHTTFISLCRNSRIIKQYEANWSVGIVFLLFSCSQTPLYRTKESHTQHQEMLNMAKRGDADSFRMVVRKHLKIVNDTLDWLIDNGGNSLFKL